MTIRKKQDCLNTFRTVFLMSSGYENTIERLERRLSLTKTPSVRISDAQKMARTLLKEYESKADYVSVQKQIKELGDYILRTEAKSS